MERHASLHPVSVDDTIALIDGEAATPLSAMPPCWQTAAAAGEGALGSPDAGRLIKLGQLFHYKMANADLDLFTNRRELAAAKPAFRTVFTQLAEETLDFYARDFRTDSYPDFDRIEGDLRNRRADRARFAVLNIARDLFEDFGHSVPASFYEVHLAPLNRDDVMEVRALRLSAEDRENARGWDAILHAQKVFPMQMRIQSISSRHGMTWLHGCQCDHSISQIAAAEAAFDYAFPVWGQERWVWTFIWNAFQEYALFDVAPVTNFFRRS